MKESLWKSLLFAKLLRTKGEENREKKAHASFSDFHDGLIREPSFRIKTGLGEEKVLTLCVCV